MSFQSPVVDAIIGVLVTNFDQSYLLLSFDQSYFRIKWLSFGCSARNSEVTLTNDFSEFSSD